MHVWHVDVYLFVCLLIYAFVYLFITYILCVYCDVTVTMATDVLYVIVLVCCDVQVSGCTQEHNGVTAQRQCGVTVCLPWQHGVE